jgi:erythromycin esterase-like protein
MRATSDRIHDLLKEVSLPAGSPSADQALLEVVGESDLVLIGEASHGTHDFYAERARLTRLLIDGKGFQAVAVEADWPDAFRVDRYVRHLGADATGEEALAGFTRFPRWMWRNRDTLAFVEELRERNASLAPQRRIGFYGLDLYSLHASTAEVIAYLDRVDRVAADRARQRYGCLDQFSDHPQVYGYLAATRWSLSCEDEVVQQLLDLRRSSMPRLPPDHPGDLVAHDDRFAAEQNARVALDAERYYRTMFSGRVSSWNLRDRHMADTLDDVRQHLTDTRGGAKIVVWEHNSHVGDARATELGDAGELTVGQLARERHGRDAVLIGFTTDHGTVTAASEWDGPARRIRVRHALPGSYERLFHECGLDRFLIPLRPHPPAGLDQARLERAIGVIYRPDTERQSHYVTCRLAAQFDAVIHLDETRAVVPLDHDPGWEPGELPETYPSAL